MKQGTQRSTETMVFKYLKKINFNNSVATRDVFEYIEVNIFWIGWASAPKNKLHKILFMAYRWIFMATAFYLPAGLFLTYALEIHTFTLNELFTSLQTGINCPGTFVRSLITFLYLEHILGLKNIFDELDKRCVDQEERKEVQRTVTNCNRTFLVYLVLYWSFATLTLSTAVLRGLTPWRIYNPFLDWRQSSANLWICSIIEYLIISTSVYSSLVTDVNPVIFGMTIRLHLKLLHRRIEKLRSNPEESDDESYKELINCIRDYNYILKSCYLVRSYLSKIIFIQFLLIGISMGLTMINIIFFSNLWTGIASVFYLIALCFQTFPFCCLCNMIDSDCNNLAFALFHANWVGASRRYKSSLIYFLLNVQKSITFTAGGIFKISLKTNITVAKFAFSVVTFVNTLNLDEKFKDY